MNRSYRAAFGPVVCLAAFWTAATSHAGTDNAVPSCYAANQLLDKVRTADQEVSADQEVFLLVDQTTTLDNQLKEDVRENFGRLVRPKSAFVVGTFSQFGQGTYTQIVKAGVLEGPLDKKTRYDTPARVLQVFDQCMAGQLKFGRQAAVDALKAALGGQSSDLANSDILSSLKELSARVRSSRAKDRVLFLVSDMLENSSISSFYASRAIRRIDPAAEMKKVQASNLVADFAGARVFVLGAGLMQDISTKDRSSSSYRDPKTIAALREFWIAYFKASNATVVEFGTPALLMPVR